MSSISVSFSGPLDEKSIAIMQNVMDAMNSATLDEESRVQKELGVSPACAMDIVYLRTRSRHTPQLEARLIREHAEGKVIMICDWPKHSDENYDPFTGKPL